MNTLGEKYKERMSFFIFYGENQKDYAQITLFGDLNDESAAWAAEKAQSNIPDEFCYAESKKVGFSFLFKNYRSYKQILELTKRVTEIFSEEGWSESTGGSIHGLASSEDFKVYAQLAEKSNINLLDENADELFKEAYPSEPNIHGCNIATGFDVCVEKNGESPKFSEEEINKLKALMQDLQKEIFRKVLPLQ